MATITGPKHKICRTVGYCIHGSAKCPSIRRPYAPGHRPNARRKKRSAFSEQLLEKQKLRLTYGMMEKQFYATFAEAVHHTGNTADIFLSLLESRLASLVWRMGLARTVWDARQLVNHGHVTVNGQRVDIPSYRVKPGEVIDLHPKAKELDRVKSALQTRVGSGPGYLELQENGVGAKFLGISSVADIPVTRINVQKIVEFYSK